MNYTDFIYVLCIFVIGCIVGHSIGYDDGVHVGSDVGFGVGFDTGYEDGHASGLFDGIYYTSGTIHALENMTPRHPSNSYYINGYNSIDTCVYTPYEKVTICMDDLSTQYDDKTILWSGNATDVPDTIVYTVHSGKTYRITVSTTVEVIPYNLSKVYDEIDVNNMLVNIHPPKKHSTPYYGICGNGCFSVYFPDGIIREVPFNEVDVVMVNNATASSYLINDGATVVLSVNLNDYNTIRDFYNYSWK